MPEDAGTAAAPPRARARDRLRLFAVRHRIFATVLLLAAGLRATAVLGYRPVEWFNDSYGYVTAAVHLLPDTIRPSGYALFLVAFEPLHRFVVVVFVQHLLGLATGVLIYAVLRARGVREWIAVLAAVPILFDAYEVQLEHLVMADTLFMFLATAAIVLLCLRNQPGWPAAAAAGLLLGASAAVRTDGRPLLVVAAVCLIVRRAGWRQVTALALAGLLPIGAYMAWFHAERGKYALTQGDGAFLYSRAMAFADCAKMKPPAALRVLCDSRPPSQRAPSGDYIWGPNPLRTYSANYPWSPQASKLGADFAFLAVRKQPLDYVWATSKDVALTFTWARSQQFPDPDTASQYRFSMSDVQVPSWVPKADLNLYQPGALTTHVHQPYAALLVNYQRYFYFRGPLLLATMLIGAAWVVTGRQRGAPGLLPWCAAAALIVVPAATAGFSYRYVLAAIPSACIAAGLATVSGRIRRVSPPSLSPTQAAVSQTGTADIEPAQTESAQTGAAPSGTAQMRGGNVRRAQATSTPPGCMAMDCTKDGASNDESR